MQVQCKKENTAMKKRLLSVFLCLCMVFGLVPATVWAETTNGHTHYLCGGSTCNGSGHENETYKTTFEKEIKQEGNTLKIGDKSWAPTKVSNNTFYILPAGTYYLGSDISRSIPLRLRTMSPSVSTGTKSRPQTEWMPSI